MISFFFFLLFYWPTSGGNVGIIKSQESLTPREYKLTFRIGTYCIILQGFYCFRNICPTWHPLNQWFINIVMLQHLSKVFLIFMATPPIPQCPPPSIMHLHMWHILINMTTEQVFPSGSATPEFLLQPPPVKSFIFVTWLFIHLFFVFLYVACGTIVCVSLYNLVFYNDNEIFLKCSWILNVK